jgi:hypothetical protein
LNERTRAERDRDEPSDIGGFIDWKTGAAEREFVDKNRLIFMLNGGILEIYACKHHYDD